MISRFTLFLNIEAIVLYMLWISWKGAWANDTSFCCHTTMEKAQGRLQTAQNFWRNASCRFCKRWEITVPPGNYVVLTFDHFYLDQWTCLYDIYVNIHDGNKRSNNILGSRCGQTDGPFNISSSSNTMSVEMLSGSKGDRYIGFTARYMAMDFSVSAAPPFFDELATRTAVLSGQPSLLWCHAHGAPAPFITWFKDGKVLQNSSSVTYKTSFKEEDGLYECVASNSAGSARKKNSVDVQNCSKACTCSMTKSNPALMLVNCTLESLTEVPNDLPAGAQYLSIERTGLVKLTKDVFRKLESLKRLDTNYNVHFKIIQAGTFRTLSHLEYLYLHHNSLRQIDTKAFEGLGALRTLTLRGNKLHQISVNLYNLANLDLSENQISSSSFGPGCLYHLDLSRNNLSTLPIGFENLSKLGFLNLSENRLSTLPTGIFSDLSELRFLDLSTNEFSQIDTGVFKGLSRLKTLYLHKNKLTLISPDSFSGLDSLEELHLQDNLLKSMPRDTFASFRSLEDVKLDSFSLCCYATKYIGSDFKCEYPKTEKDKFSSCNRMIEAPGPRRCIWLLGFLAVLGNLAVVVWRLVRRDDHPVQTCLLTNLAVADFLMGIYLMIIAIKDQIWAGSYFEFDLTWRSGTFCKVTGVLSVLSSEVSVLMLTVITADRVISILFTFCCNRLTLSATYVICAVVWIGGAIIAVVPSFDLQIPYFYNEERQYGFYGRSSVCLPIQLSSERLAGWEYSMAVFVALNMAAFLFMLSAYIAIILKVYRSQRRLKAHGQAEMSSNLKRESALARRVLAIIMTDFSCWIPVIILSILAITGNFHDAEGLVYVWFAVFVLPVNSSVNPVLYTFSTPKVRRVLKRGFLYLCGCIRGKVSRGLQVSGRSKRASREGKEDESIFVVSMAPLQPPVKDSTADADIGKSNPVVTTMNNDSLS